MNPFTKGQLDGNYFLATNAKLPKDSPLMRCILPVKLKCSILGQLSAKVISPCDFIVVVKNNILGVGKNSSRLDNVWSVVSSLKWVFSSNTPFVLNHTNPFVFDNQGHSLNFGALAWCASLQVAVLRTTSSSREKKGNSWPRHTSTGMASNCVSIVEVLLKGRKVSKAAVSWQQWNGCLGCWTIQNWQVLLQSNRANY